VYGADFEGDTCDVGVNASLATHQVERRASLSDAAKARDVPMSPHGSSLPRHYKTARADAPSTRRSLPPWWSSLTSTTQTMP
jgi:hypothetical protein